MKPHRIMTLQEYAEGPIVGWHRVCRNVDGFGNVGVIFEEQDKLSQSSYWRCECGEAWADAIKCCPDCGKSPAPQDRA
jgi:hypothetical protein